MRIIEIEEEVTITKTVRKVELELDTDQLSLLLSAMRCLATLSSSVITPKETGQRDNMKKLLLRAEKGLIYGQLDSVCQECEKDYYKHFAHCTKSED